MIDTDQLQSAEEILTNEELEKEEEVFEAEMTPSELVKFLKNNPQCSVTIIPLKEEKNENQHKEEIIRGIRQTAGEIRKQIDAANHELDQTELMLKEDMEKESARKNYAMDLFAYNKLYGSMFKAYCSLLEANSKSESLDLDLEDMQKDILLLHERIVNLGYGIGIVNTLNREGVA